MREVADQGGDRFFVCVCSRVLSDRFPSTVFERLNVVRLKSLFTFRHQLVRTHTYFSMLAFYKNARTANIAGHSAPEAAAHQLLRCASATRPDCRPPPTCDPGPITVSKKNPPPTLTGCVCVCGFQAHRRPTSSSSHERSPAAVPFLSN